MFQVLTSLGRGFGYLALYVDMASLRVGVVGRGGRFWLDVLRYGVFCGASMKSALTEDITDILFGERLLFDDPYLGRDGYGLGRNNESTRQGELVDHGGTEELREALPRKMLGGTLDIRRCQYIEDLRCGDDNRITILETPAGNFGKSLQWMLESFFRGKSLTDDA